MKPCLVVAFSCLALIARASAEPGAPPELPAFIKGYNWGWIGQRGEYAAPEAAVSMAKLAETGTEWVSIAFAGRMTDPNSTEIQWGDGCEAMVSDAEVRGAIAIARANGMKVILKPSIVIDDGTWRAWIKFFRPISEAERAQGIAPAHDPWRVKKDRGPLEGMTIDQDKWDAWWADFRAFSVHYARLAESEQVPILCVGGEMLSTESHEADWRKLIAEVRAVYSGSITYNANHGHEMRIAWWDALDFASISAYYGMFPEDEVDVSMIQATTTIEELSAHLRRQVGRMRLLHIKIKKPILFIETGVTNVRAASRYPWSHIDQLLDSPVDEQEQANFYQAMFEVFWNERWLMGYCWWDWPAQLAEPDPAGRSFGVYGKQAENVLRDWYAKDR